MKQYDISARVAQLYIHPIKSCAAIAVDSALLTPTGLQYDRHWMLVNDANAHVTQREFARMALIRPSIDVSSLRLQAPDMPELCIPLDAQGELIRVTVWKSCVSAFLMDDEVNAWFSRFLATTVRLVRFNESEPRVCSRQWTGEHRATTEFTDGYPLLVTTSAAVDELNQRLQAKGFDAVDQRRFRPNIVMADVPAHDEDLFDTIHIEADEAVCIKNVKPCTRCSIPSINPDTAVYQPEMVGDALQNYRVDARMNGEITFGINAIVLRGSGQVLRVGQRIFADYVL